MPRIQVLSDLLVNKIAAGEVIERPASVVKELVENALDAGGEHIEIAIEEGGRRLIRVTDDGGGMDRDDLAMCVRPHATSKIRSEDDLFGIRTMGFRGEALPSIGAVSQLHVLSRRPGSDEAYETRVVGDRLEPVTAASGPPGTTVEVRELFFNVPARQKFLRTAQTEIGHITEQLARIALVAPRVEFRLLHNGRLVHQLRSASGMRPRIADFYGAELADALLEVHRDERGLKVGGYVASPVDSRSSSKWQYVFLNGRFIRDRFVSAAVREAYRGLMDANRYPVIFLAMEVDPASVDVNVHPTKIEVRWRDSNVIYSQVLSTLRDRFLSSDLTPRLQTGRASAGLFGGTPGVAPAEDAPLMGAGMEGAGGGTAGASYTPSLSGVGADGADPRLISEDPAEVRRREIRASIAEFLKNAPSVVGGPRLEPPSGFGTDRQDAGPTAHRRDAGATPIGGLEAGADVWPAPTTGSSADASPGLGAPRSGVGDFPDPQHVLQVHRTYLVAETEDGLMIIDQHALHERILYEQFCERITTGPLESQRLLIPDLIDVSADQVGLIETHADELQKLGFELTPYGPSTLAVHAAPSILSESRVREFLRDLLDRLSERSAPASSELVMNDLLSMMACKAAVKAGDALTDAEIQALMRQRHCVDRSTNCPHGRPTTLRLSIRDLERQFKRA
jgi:DNA mismatch repair protein MutL